MLKIIETGEHLHRLGDACKKYTSIWIPILQNTNKTIHETSISFIYVYITTLNLDFIIGINHEEIPKHRLADIYTVFDNSKKIVYDSSYLNGFSRNGSIDASLICWYNTMQNYNFNDFVDKYRMRFYYEKFKNIELIGDYIPIMIYADTCRQIRNMILIEVHNLNDKAGLKFYNDHVLTELNYIESSGIYVNPEIMKIHFNNYDGGNITYTKFNMFTKTGRPSSHFNNINYSALNKSSGERSALISRFENGVLGEFDYDSYHFRLVGELFGYDFGLENIHEHFGKIYFQTETLTEAQYNESKQISFRQLYGQTDELMVELEFFKLLVDFKNNLWDSYLKNGYVEIPISKKKIQGDKLGSMNRNKLFNYLTQAYETERNILTIGNIRKFLENKKTKLVLYTYDSFLFDIDRKDGIDVLYDLKKILEENKMPTTISIGFNYNELKKVKIDEKRY